MGQSLNNYPLYRGRGRVRARRARGFSLIELLVTMAVAGILIGLAVPGFSSFLRSNRAQVQTSLFVNSLNYARAEAIRRGVPVRVTPLGSEWTSGWRVWADVNSNSTLDTNEELRNVPALTGNATLGSTATSVVFNRSGFANGVTVGTTVTFEYRLGSGYCKLERDITINHLGRVMIERRAC